MRNGGTWSPGSEQDLFLNLYATVSGFEVFFCSRTAVISWLTVELMVFYTVKRRKEIKGGAKNKPRGVWDNEGLVLGRSLAQRMQAPYCSGAPGAFTNRGGTSFNPVCCMHSPQ